jgi:minor extracellular serine protease Vpr
LDRSYELVDGGLGKKEELKKALGKIVLVKRGELTFTEKAENAARAGAVAVIIYNNMNGPFLGNIQGESEIPVMSTSKKDGKVLKEKLVKNHVLVKTDIIEERHLLADFSSRGPVTSTWEVKPDLVAPGVAINSTIPGGYLSLQGTSMAAPHVAGACALIKQAHPEWNPEQVKAALMNYSKPLVNHEGEQYKTYEQGAGRIQLLDSINADLLVYPASLQFGRFQLSDRLHEHEAVVTLENTGSENKSISFDIPKNEKGLEWHVPMRVQLKPGENKKVKIQLTANPEKLKDKIQDGMLAIQSDGRTIHLPYLFVLEEPNYPRVMGFDFGAGDNEETSRYEVYLPGGAEEFGIALFNPDTYQFVQFLDWKRNITKGLLQKDLANNQLPPDGIYLAKVFARKAGQEDQLELMLEIKSHN